MFRYLSPRWRPPRGAISSVVWFFAAVSSPVAAETLAAETLAAETPRTLRVDYFHTGNASQEIFSLDRVVVEPLPWPGNQARPLDATNLGKYRFEVFDRKGGPALYSRGFASIYGEWETTGEARERYRTFHESLRFPHPAGPVEIVLSKRDAQNAFVEVWRFTVDPNDMFVDTSAAEGPPAGPELIALQDSGDPATKVDLLLLGDGYTAAEQGKFERDAKRMMEALFAVSPFAERRADFNVWGLVPAAPESGVSRPSTGIHRRSPVGTTYDAFGSERYVLTFDNRAFRQLAARAPYEFVEILVNNETYGGGGIFGLFGTVAVDSEFAEYVFVHEFGHHFAGLADEYYTSSVAYEIPDDPIEPWEVNATVLRDPAELKWKDLVEPGTAIPSPWPKETFESHSLAIQERRRMIRTNNRPESEMSALFREQQTAETELLGSALLAGKVGAFEGGNYAARGTYRPQIDCIMFSRNEVPFCAVCQRGLEQVIDLYAGAASP
ncbi:MAG: IgA Peptidase M64 [Acidobacteriota bacterium]